MIAAADTLPDGPLVAWYGDDFTGSAAVMEVLSFAGLPSVLFAELPTDAQMARFTGMRGVGIASTARAQSPDWMAAELPWHFDWLRHSKAPIMHYKACSTLDSAPDVGSIGKAVEIGLEHIDTPWVPMLFAAPPIRRYQAFGTLFAAVGDRVYRLDRHPSMAHHPVTPMDEADVCAHLARQTSLPIAALDVEALATDADAGLAALRESGTRLIALDTVDAGHLERCGSLIWNNRGSGLLTVGSQGVEYALVAAWRATGALTCTDTGPSIGSVDRIAVVSGSAAEITAQQIAWSEANGYAVLAVDAADLVLTPDRTIREVVDRADAALAARQDPVIATARGPADPSIVATRARLSEAGLSPGEAQARIGAGLGRILRALLERTDLTRAIVAGGDTSGHVMRALDVYAFTALAPTIPGAALLQAHSESARFDGLQVALKGGQMGSRDFFGWIKSGGGQRAGHKEGLKQ